MVWIAAAGLVMSALSGVSEYYAGKKEALAFKDQAEMNSMLKQLESENIREQASKQAEQIRFAAGRARSTQRTQQAKSGIVVGEGSAQVAQDDITSLSEADVLVTGYNAVNGIVSNQASSRFLQQAGANSASAARQRGQASLLTAGANIADSLSAYKAYNTPRDSGAPALKTERSAQIATGIN